jgi:phage terminase small subunit
MSERYLEQLKATLKNFKEVKPDQMQGLLKETLDMFRELQGKLKSADPKEQEEAKEMALKIRDELNLQADRLMQETGLNLQELVEKTKNNPITQQASELIQTEMARMQNDIGIKPAAKRHKIKPQWIAG